MRKSEKRSFDQMEQSTVDIHVFSAREHHHSLEISAAQRPMFVDKPINQFLDLDVKLAALKASPYIVALVSFSGDVVLSQGCGTIIEVNENDNTVMTSLNLIRRPTEAEIGENDLADNLKIVVRSFDEKSYVGEIYTYDFHYNLLVIKFKSISSCQSAKLKMIDDDRGLEKSFQLRRYSLETKVGDPVVVVGRYYCKSFDLMAAAGRFSMDHCDSEYDCRELLSSSCLITRCGDGGPLINLSAEVIGITFFEIGAITTPVLPINIAYKWWNHYERFKELRHPSYGFEASNLYTADLLVLERVMRRSQSISNGLLVETVLPGSYAESAGLREDDVILTCDGRAVKTFLEFWDLMWDKVGEVIELEVDRAHDSTLTITMAIGEVLPDQLNKWPRNDYPGRM